MVISKNSQDTDLKIKLAVCMDKPPNMKHSGSVGHTIEQVLYPPRSSEGPINTHIHDEESLIFPLLSEG